MDYKTISKDEAIDIIEKSISDNIIKYERNEKGKTSIDKIDKKTCNNLILESSSIAYNEDLYVPNMDLFFGGSNRNNLTYTDRYISILFLTS